MKNLTGKTLVHVDGRQGYCLSTKPYLGKVEVVVAGRREQWGQADVRMTSLLQGLGLLAKGARG